MRAANRRALVCYATAGHPDRQRSIALLQGLADAGADVLEVGVPFSDPVADGPVIQGSSQQALEQGMTLDGALELITEAKLSVPVVLFSYLNPLIAAGPDVLVRAHEHGVHGVLITDLPVGADPAREAWFGQGPLEFVRLVAPTTPKSRMAEIAKHGRGFVYLGHARRDVEFAAAVDCRLAFGVHASDLRRLWCLEAGARPHDRRARRRHRGWQRDRAGRRAQCAGRRRPHPLAPQRTRRDPAGRLMQLLLTAYARLVPLAGTALLLAAVSLDFEWTRHGPALAFLIVVTLAFRKYQLPVTKYSALNLLGVVATGGALVAGPTTAAIAMFVGVLAGDLMLLRKEISASWINAGRFIRIFRMERRCAGGAGR
jgi:hypothetical protein